MWAAETCTHLELKAKAHPLHTHTPDCGFTFHWVCPPRLSLCAYIKKSLFHTAKWQIPGAKISKATLVIFQFLPFFWSFHIHFLESSRETRSPLQLWEECTASQGELRGTPAVKKSKSYATQFYLGDSWTTVMPWGGRLQQPGRRREQIEESKRGTREWICHKSLVSVKRRRVCSLEICRYTHTHAESFKNWTCMRALMFMYACVFLHTCVLLSA